jgi:hypothetical protein
MKMTTEFKIDKPGVYCDRSGRHVNLWPTLSDGHKQWMEIGTFNAGTAYFINGQFWSTQGHFAAWDIVAYVSPLPAEILQRMVEALESAEYCPHQATPATFGEALKAMAEEQPKLAYEQREKHACEVCGNVPDEDGFIEHGRGCYVVNEDGGGITLVDFNEEAKQ